MYLHYLIQTCSEMVIPIGIEKDTMFEPNPFILKRYVEGCKTTFGVSPRPHWVTTYYGAHVIILSFLLFIFYLKTLTMNMLILFSKQID